MKKQNTIFTLIIILVLIISLSGCKSKETPANTPAESGDKINNNVEIYLEVDRDNVLIVGGTSPKGVFNPIRYSTISDLYITDLMFERLLNTEIDGTLTTEGSLTENYSISEDGLVYTFKIRQGINWHDGKPVTANDVAWTFNAIFAPDYKGDKYNIGMQKIVGAKEVKEGKEKVAEGIKVLDEYTLEITVSEAKATTLNNLSIWVMPKHYYGDKTADELVDLDYKPMGNGSFKLKNYQAGKYVEMEANPDYWQGVPKLEGIVYKVIPSDELSEFQEKKVDAVNFNGTIANYEAIEGYDDKILINNTNNKYEYIAFNFKNPILTDKRVRQALVYGLDRQGFIDSNFGNMGGVIANGPMSPVSWAYPDESELNSYKFNKEKAIGLLEESGWIVGEDGIREKDGKKLEFTCLSYKESEWSIEMANLAASQWKEIGVDCTVEFMDLNSLSDLTLNPENIGEWDMFNMAWEMETDPDIYRIFSKNQFPPGNNRGYFENEEIERLMLDGFKELNQEKRKEIYQELTKQFNEELPYIFLYMRMDPWVVNNKVKNFTPSEFQMWTHNAHKIEIE